MACFALFLTAAARDMPAADAKLAAAAAVLDEFSAQEDQGIPTQLLERAYGVAVIPNVIRGGFIIGARRGRGVLVVRTPNGGWSNPSFITLTGGSIGWQFGAESADLVLVFANKESVRNIASGKFTLGGDASAVAGPLGRHAAAAVTFKAEVYSYFRSEGLFAGASFEGARLAIDREMNRAFYAADAETAALNPQNGQTPASARRFLLALEQASIDSEEHAPEPGTTGTPKEAPEEEAVTFPLEN